MKKKQYLPIKPQFLKNKQGKTQAIYLDLNSYESIFAEIEALKKKIKKYQEKSTYKK